MKLLKLFTTAMCVFGVAAQRSFIEAPITGATVSVGKKFTVQLVRPVRIPAAIKVQSNLLIRNLVFSLRKPE
jgi:hypothetical protein